MKKSLLSLFVVLLFANCQKIDEKDFALFGESFDINEKTISKEALLKYYQDEKRTDTLEVVFASKIINVCQKKGCWMTLDLGGDEDENFIKFKDYAFFVPLNAAESETIIKGKAYRKVESVEALKHYAEDAGESQEEIDAITEPEITYYFMADGVYIKK